MSKITSGKGNSRLTGGLNALDLMEEERDDIAQTYKNRMMVHDIHRVRELSALLEERRRFFDGQLGEVYRNAGVSSPNTSLPRLRSLNRDHSPPASPSPSPSNSNMTDISLVGNNMGSIELGSARSYSVFADADDELSVADSFDFAGDRDRVLKASSRNRHLAVGSNNTKNWNPSTNPHSQLGRVGENSGIHFGDHRISLTSKYSECGRNNNNNIKDSIQNEVMRTADLEKKLKARRSSLPLALEASLKRPLKKKNNKITNATNISSNNNNNRNGMKKDKDNLGGGAVMNLLSISNLLSNYADSSDAEDSSVQRGIKFSRKFSMPTTTALSTANSGTKISWDASSHFLEGKDRIDSNSNTNLNYVNSTPSNFSMTQILRTTRKYDLSQDLKRNLDSVRHSQKGQNLNKSKARSTSSNNNNNNINGELVSNKTSKTSFVTPSSSWDTEILGEAPRRTKSNKYSNFEMTLNSIKSETFDQGGSAKSLITTAVPSSSILVNPFTDYSPRSSLSTSGTGSCPRIAFSSLEKLYREEGDKSRGGNNNITKGQQLHPSQLLLKPVPKIDMNLFNEPSNSEPDYSHDFRYLSLVDALVPVYERGQPWKPPVRAKTYENPTSYERDAITHLSP